MGCFSGTVLYCNLNTKIQQVYEPQININIDDINKADKTIILFNNQQNMRLCLYGQKT